MLSSLAKYIFGGIFNNATEEPIEYETRDVNDWCLVNLPDQTADEIDLDTEEDDDEILAALPLLMMQNEELDDSPCSISEMEFSASLSDSSCSEMTLSCCNFPATVTERNVIPHKIIPMLSEESWERILCILEYHMPRVDQIIRDLEETRRIVRGSWGDKGQMHKEILSHYANVKRREEEKRYIEGWNERQMLNRSLESARKTLYFNIKSMGVNLKGYPVNHKRHNSTYADKRTGHPAEYSRNYVNHRSPALPLHTELLEQIENLKPVQRASEYVTKKNITRSQLCRRNKTYLYESSAKTNRRKNLQRNPSGANNNRRC